VALCLLYEGQTKEKHRGRQIQIGDIKMKYRNFSTVHNKEHSRHTNRALHVDGDAIVVFENEIVDLPRRCIHCSSDVTLHRREQEISARHQYITKAQALVSYYLCQDHAKSAEKNGFLIAGWLALSFLLARVVPIGFAVVAFIAMGIGVFLILRKTMLELKVHKYEAGKFWVTGFSKQFLDDLSSNHYVR
jgi:hypothetical protein